MFDISSGWRAGIPEIFIRFSCFAKEVLAILGLTFDFLDFTCVFVYTPYPKLVLELLDGAQTSSYCLFLLVGHYVFNLMADLTIDTGVWCSGKNFCNLFNSCAIRNIGPGYTSTFKRLAGRKIESINCEQAVRFGVAYPNTRICRSYDLTQLCLANTCFVGVRSNVIDRNRAECTCDLIVHSLECKNVEEK